MTDLDKLREALREPPAEPFAEPDLTRIMAAGTRIRRRRRVLTGAGAAAVAAAIVLVVGSTVYFRQSGDVMTVPPAASPAPSAPMTTSKPADPAKEPMGTVVGTGIHDATGEIVLYAVRVDEPRLPEVRFGVMAGHRTAGGTIVPGILSNETKGADYAFGFHAVSSDVTNNSGHFPVFGYFSGDVARITSTVRGKTVDAKLGKWQEGNRITFFWFDPADVPSASLLTPLVAYDAQAKRLTG
ncbi:hypothetical protein [Amycolatopsis sp. NPDC059021]|uniref:hypothetical protein n=1 Tax=Amycolatopsis sp. NPDC059021 TaxID=3346704 RepID=UPI0036733313